MPKRAYFGQNLAVFGSNFLIFYWRKQKFRHPHNRKPPQTPCLQCFFGRPWDQTGQKCQYLAQNDQKCIFWGRIGRFWAKHLNSFWIEPKFWFPHIRKSFFCGNNSQFLPTVRFLPCAWWPFSPLDPSQYLFSFLSYNHLSAEVRFFLKIFIRPLCETLCVVNSPCVEI